MFKRHQELLELKTYQVVGDLNFKLIKFCIVWTVKLSLHFLEVIGIKLDYTSKR
jgi:hypothetical protein